MGRLGSLWRLEGDFGRFWLGQTISGLGDAFTGFALPLLIYQVTGSALSLAISSAAAFLPYLLFGLVIGAWVDRVDRRRLMLLADIARALLIASIPLLLAAGFFALWYIYIVQFITAMLAVGFNSAQPAALASLVERDQLRAANGRIIAGHSAGWMVGPLLAGGLATVLPLPALLLVDALSYVASALVLGLIHTSFNRHTTRPAGLLADIAAGLRYVWTQPVIRAITLLLVLLNAVGPTARVQIVLFAKQQLQASDGQVGMLSAAAAAGVLLASLGTGRARRWPASRMSIGALLAQGLLLLAFAQTRHFWAALALWALMAGLSVIVDVNIMSLRQLIAPDHMLGRITAITRTVGFAAIPLNALIGGVLIDRLGDVAAIYRAIGVLTLLIGLGFSFSALARAE